MYVCMYEGDRSYFCSFFFFVNTSILMGSREELSYMFIYTYVHMNMHNF